MGLAFTVKGLQTSVILKDKQISGLAAAVDQQKGEIVEAHLQEKLANDNYKNSQSDLRAQESKVKNLQNKNLLHKVMLWITVPIVIIETGWIGLTHYIKKAP